MSLTRTSTTVGGRANSAFPVVVSADLMDPICSTGTLMRSASNICKVRPASTHALTAIPLQKCKIGASFAQNLFARRLLVTAARRWRCLPIRFVSAGFLIANAQAGPRTRIGSTAIRIALWRGVGLASALAFALIVASGSAFAQWVAMVLAPVKRLLEPPTGRGGDRGGATAAGNGAEPQVVTTVARIAEPMAPASEDHRQPTASG
jgi:hypothetical protein